MAGDVLTAGEVPEKNKRRSVAARGAAKRARRSRKKVISQAKACTIMREGAVHGKALTDKQRGFMAARCEGRPAKRRAA
jgi:hypothetical protein